MKFFAAFLPLLCLYLLSSPEASAADTHQVDQRLEQASPQLSQTCGTNSETGKMFVLAGLLPERDLFFVSVSSFEGFSRVFHLVSTRDFKIHTGLSPPLYWVC
ncbi:MAG: hypothetical protein A2X86_09410 [Bdellovibrionales bacterium GWA2_49_15]|nr:MAG: hypothetical protein A2X86_09410 [Bdellovibrionales bacterium GWA2_49_15]HAZ12996.1 hypothetical protein [Bdellovibrionales bacterium]